MKCNHSLIMGRLNSNIDIITDGIEITIVIFNKHSLKYVAIGICIAGHTISPLIICATKNKTA